nr:G protein-coupled receptor [Proales similis]
MNESEREASCWQEIHSMELLSRTKLINVYATTAIISIGLLGNALALFVFIQKRFRIHSSSIYLLCLALSDGLFLLMHFFEDTTRSYIDAFSNGAYANLRDECHYLVEADLAKKNMNEWVRATLRTISIIDQSNMFCRTVNYFRYLLRFVSAYIIVTFTIQRAIAIKWPFSQAKLESNKLAWTIILILTLSGCIFTAWVPFLFRLRPTPAGSVILDEYCDVERQFSSIYFHATIVYVVITMLLPIILIFIFNLLIIVHIWKASRARQNLSATSEQNDHADALLKTTLSLKSKRTANQSLVKRSAPVCSASVRKKSTNESYKITRMLLFLSFSYAFLNLPYVVSWCVFFYLSAFGNDLSVKDSFNLFSVLNICEIFYILNYGIHFFVYCASGKKFRSQLRNALSCSRT